MKVKIRPMKQHDLPYVKQLNEQCLPENYPQNLWLALFTTSGGRSHSYVAAHGTGIVGYIFGTKSGHIISFAVDEKYRKKGLGKSLIQCCLQSYAKVSGGILIKLNVRTTNEPAIALYEKFGFQIAAQVMDYYKNPVEDAYEMNRLSGDISTEPIRFKFNLNGLKE